MHAFQSLGSLGQWAQDNPNVTIVDAGVPISDYFSSNDFGPVWKSQPSVRKVVGFVARNIASLPLNLYQRVGDNDRKRVRTGPLAQLLSSPSTAPGETPFRFFERLLIDGLLTDRWVAHRKVNPDGSHELVRLPSRHVRLKSNQLDRIVAVRVRNADGEFEDRDPSDFVLDVGYAERGASGTSPLITLHHLLQEQREAVEYRRSVWKRGARIPGVIERPTPWPADGKARENFRRSWEKFSRGGGAEGGTPLLEDGMKYTELGAFKPQDTGDLEGRRLTDMEVASAYFIAPELVGAREGNFSNMQAFRQMLFSVALGPYIIAFEQALNQALVPWLAPDQDVYIEANVEAKMRGSFEDQAAAMQSATGAPWMTRNETRAMRNLPAIAGGDGLVVPLNVLIGGQSSPRDSGSQNVNAAPRPTTKVAALLSRESSSAPLKIKSGMREEDAAAAQQVLTRFFKRQRDRVLKALASKDATAWWDEDRWNSELSDDLYALAMSVTQEIASDTLNELGIDPDLYSAERTAKFLRAVADSRAGAINSTTRDQIEAALADELDDGAEKSTPAGVFDIAESSRAEQAGTTLATTLAGFAVTEAASQLNRPRTTKTWVVTSANPRPSHAAMNGETVAMSEDFSNGAPWPGSAVLDVDEVAGCSCVVEITIP